MPASLLDGKAVSHAMREELKKEVATLKDQGIIPGLGVLLVGDDPASRSYVTAKEKACSELGVYSREVRKPAQATKREVLDTVRAYNEDEHIDGILVQLPLPDPSMENMVVSAIHPRKDVDGFHPVNVGKMMLGLPTFYPCTPHGVLQLLHRSGVATRGRHVVIVGRSNLVGRPLANLLSQKTEAGNATVTLCHTATTDLKAHTSRADILIVAVGRPGAVTADMVKADAVVVDVGVNRVEDALAKRGYRLVGDVDFQAVKEKAAAITPVPGGVGPMTITMLLYNTVQAARRRAKVGVAP